MENENKKLAVNIVQAVLSADASAGKVFVTAEDIASSIEVVYKKLKTLD